ncbi:hypothetical protein V6N11_060168 [Hibiscus sabdariffa]|uniref:Uncharacterized protein n=1 Tax=Hibiscus sabdariffa TaxID=183260 RepID=A0ABR2P3G4_9ROSI
MFSSKLPDLHRIARDCFDELFSSSDCNHVDAILDDCIIDQMASIMCNYWWSGHISGKGWSIIAWKKLYVPRRASGLAFRDLHQFNAALLGKQDIAKAREVFVPADDDRILL